MPITLQTAMKTNRLFLLFFLLLPLFAGAQRKTEQQLRKAAYRDSLFRALPADVHTFLDNKPTAPSTRQVAVIAEALNSKALETQTKQDLSREILATSRMSQVNAAIANKRKGEIQKYRRQIRDLRNALQAELNKLDREKPDYQQQKAALEKRFGDEIDEKMGYIIQIQEERYNANRCGFLPVRDKTSAKLFYSNPAISKDFKFVENVGTNISGYDGSLFSDIISATKWIFRFDLSSQVTAAFQRPFFVDAKSRAIQIDSALLRENALSNLINGGGNILFNVSYPVFYKNFDAKSFLKSSVDLKSGFLLTENDKNNNQDWAVNLGLNWNVNSRVNITDNFDFYAILDTRFIPLGNDLFFREIFLRDEILKGDKNLGFFSANAGLKIFEQFSLGVKMFYSFNDSKVQDRPFLVSINYRPGIK